MSMTPDAKKTLSSTIRGLRERLLTDLHNETERVYRLSVRAKDAELPARLKARRSRIEAWIREQQRADAARGKTAEQRSDDDYRREIEHEAAATLLNRLVVLRLIEASPGAQQTQRPPVVTKGWNSQGYRHFRELAPALVRDDETEGYAFLLRLVFDDLATELPGIFGANGLADLVPVPAGTLRHIIDKLDDDALETCWTDDMTLGWVYQYWNDPARERLDDKLNPKKKWGSGKIEPHEIASKTQMFTERYMVDWLLQNSLGPMWLAMCKKHGWTPRAESEGTLDGLDERRADWRERRADGSVALTELMPLHTDAERRWAYYVPQPIPDDTVVHAPDTLCDLKLLDPAVGSGHFLVVALELLFSLYQEEAAHRGETGSERWTDTAIVERILSHNLHGIDLDPRAVQIAAAALWLKARQLAPGARPSRLNLVASNLRLASLPEDDEALVELRREVERETGIPGTLTDQLIGALKGADHLGSLLKVDKAVDEAIARLETGLGRVVAEQGDLYRGYAPQQQRLAIGRAEAKATLLDRIETFLAAHTKGDDLGLRLRGQQLAAGVRFVRMVREGVYDIVVANPPYAGSKSLSDMGYVETNYPEGKADLFAAMLLRGLSFLRKGGVVSMLTMRNWMFITSYEDFRSLIMSQYHLGSIADLQAGAFKEIGGIIVSVCATNIWKLRFEGTSVALNPNPAVDGPSSQRTELKAAALRAQENRYPFSVTGLKAIPEWPVVYHWNADFLKQYTTTNLMGEVGAVRQGLTTSNNGWFVRRPWEVDRIEPRREGEPRPTPGWVPYIKGGRGAEWIEPLSFVVNWGSNGLAIKVLNEELYGSHSRSVRSEDRYFEVGSAYTTMGNSFGGRSHRFRSICDAKGRTVYDLPHREVTCLLNSSLARRTVESLNPTSDFSVGDVNRLPAFRIDGCDEIFELLEQSFSAHESHREASVEYVSPGPSTWSAAQRWAQDSVDRPTGAPLPKYTQKFVPEPPTDHLSFALGVALGRFGPAGGGREGILDPASADLSHALPHGLLFLDTTCEDHDLRDGLGHPAAAPLHDAWVTHGPAIDAKRGLRDYLATQFFKVHKAKEMYDNRPIHWPLSSANKTFVAWVNIHRFTDRTLRVLLADHLLPAQERFEGELIDLRNTRDGADKEAAKRAERRFPRVRAALDELESFIAAVEACADQGPPPTDHKCPAREQDARYAPDLDDGVMVNSAALWPLLDPQWKDPKKWWTQLASSPPGNASLDWSHLAMRYWPTRVDTKCKKDPSLAVAHGCFWRYHPARAWAWELRLQDEIEPSFRIEESPYRPGGRELGDTGDASHRTAFLRDHTKTAIDIIESEASRRMGRGKDRKVVPEMTILETGLWTAEPLKIWKMELALSGKQSEPFRLRAPDEPEARAALLRDRSAEAIQAIKDEALARMKKAAVKKRMKRFQLEERGLWTHHAAALWELELKLSDKLRREYRIVAPDEPEARASYEAANPARAAARRRLLGEAKVQRGLFASFRSMVK